MDMLQERATGEAENSPVDPRIQAAGVLASTLAGAGRRPSPPGGEGDRE